MMSLAGISDTRLTDYLLERGFIKEGQSIHDLPEEFVNKMLEDENWSKVTETIKQGGEK